MFCIYLRTNSDLYHLQHKLIGFYNRDEKCLQRGTDWVFKLRSLRFVFKGLTCNILSEGPKNRNVKHLSIVAVTTHLVIFVVIVVDVVFVLL